MNLGDVNNRHFFIGFKIPVSISFFKHARISLAPGLEPGRVLNTIESYLRRFLSLRTPRFAKYQPALRLGTRRVEQRLLSRITKTAIETSC